MASLPINTDARRRATIRTHVTVIAVRMRRCVGARHFHGDGRSSNGRGRSTMLGQCRARQGVQFSLGAGMAAHCVRDCRPRIGPPRQSKAGRTANTRMCRAVIRVFVAPFEVGRLHNDHFAPNVNYTRGDVGRAHMSSQHLTDIVAAPIHPVGARLFRSEPPRRTAFCCLSRAFLRGTSRVSIARCLVAQC